MTLTQKRIDQLIAAHTPSNQTFSSIYEEQTSDLEPGNYDSYLRGSIEDLQAVVNALQSLRDALNA